MVATSRNHCIRLLMANVLFFFIVLGNKPRQDDSNRNTQEKS